MATLTIGNVDQRPKERLRVRAARNGRSIEAELRHILNETLAAERSREPNLAEAIRRRFAPLGDVELDPNPRVPVAEPGSTAAVWPSLTLGLHHERGIERH
jgi:plasmid stability protein